MLFKWLDENQTPYLSQADRMMGVIDSLAITSREQLKTVTRWKDTQIHNTLNRIRQMGKSKEERDKWLISWQPRPRSPHVYTLAEKGIEHVRGMKDDSLVFEQQKPVRGQVAHFMGTNEILCRIIKAGYPVETWLSQKEAMSYLYYQLFPMKSPLRPDALIKVHGVNYFIEYDLGTESGGKLEAKFHRYLVLANMIGSIHPVVWVTFNETRRRFIERKAQDALKTFEAKHRQYKFGKNEKPVQLYLPKKLPLMYCFIEGQETAFLAGSQGAKPFWEAD